MKQRMDNMVLYKTTLHIGNNYLIIYTKIIEEQKEVQKKQKLIVALYHQNSPEYISTVPSSVLGSVTYL